MTRLATDLAVLPKVLRRHVSLPAIAEAIEAVLPEDITGELRREYIERQVNPMDLNDLPVAMAILVADLQQRGLLPGFIGALIRGSSEVKLQQILQGMVAVDSDGEVVRAALENLDAAQEPFLKNGKFPDFLIRTRPQVCAIWIRHPGWGAGRFSGTGFLTGSDLVMTAHHVVQPLLSGAPDVDAPVEGAQIRCLFDYYAPIQQHLLPDQVLDVTSVGVAPNWLAWSSRPHIYDGIHHEFPPLPDRRTYLDCALIRLAEPVGLRSTRSGGGRRRSWIDLARAKYPPEINSQDLLVIIQHPAGADQATSIDRYVASDPGRTRLWYKAQAAGGSSGSPCFDSEANIVGFHNAGRIRAGAFGPHPECNQGVSIDKVIAEVPDFIANGKTPAYDDVDSLWSLGRDAAQPIPVLGRREFKQAVVTMCKPDAAVRVLAVSEAADVAQEGRSGKSFSLDVLEALTRDRPSLVLRLSADKLKGLSPIGFLRDLCWRLGIGSTAVETTPPDPADERQEARWLANDLPNWMGGQIEEWAIRGGFGAQPSRQTDAIGTAAAEVQIGKTVWIAIDDVHRSPIEGKLRELIAGMVGITDTQPLLRPGLRALRWLFVGHIPDFVRDRSIQHIVEEVSQRTVGRDQWVACVRAFYESRGDESYNEAMCLAFYAVLEQHVPAADAITMKLEKIAAVARTLLLALMAR